MGCKAVYIRFEFRPVGIDVTDEADNPGLVDGQIQNPLVVFKQSASLDDDRPDHAFGGRQFAVVLGQDRSIEPCFIFRRPGYALRTGGIVEMGVRIDNHVKFLSP